MRGLRGLGDIANDLDYQDYLSTQNQSNFWGSDGFTVGDLNTMIGTGLAVYNTVSGKVTNTQTGQTYTPPQGYTPPGYSSGYQQQPTNPNNQVGTGMSTGAIVALVGIGVVGLGTVAYLATRGKKAA